jgi:hypothetical protein
MRHTSAICGISLGAFDAPREGDALDLFAESSLPRMGFAFARSPPAERGPSTYHPCQ